MSHALKALPSMKFERRKEKQKLPAFLQSMLRILQAWGKAYVSNGLTDNAFVPNLKGIRTLFWALLHLAAGTGFDRATFQTYITMLNREISSDDVDIDRLSRDLHSNLSKELTAFGSSTRLTSGLSMERIWLRFKPNTPKTIQEYDTILALERLADRLDAAMWKSSLGIEDMARIRERFSSALAMVRSSDVDGEELVKASCFSGQLLVPLILILIRILNTPSMNSKRVS